MGHLFAKFTLTPPSAFSHQSSTSSSVIVARSLRSSSSSPSVARARPHLPTGRSSPCRCRPPTARSPAQTSTERATDTSPAGCAILIIGHTGRRPLLTVLVPPSCPGGSRVHLREDGPLRARQVGRQARRGQAVRRGTPLRRRSRGRHHHYLNQKLKCEDEEEKAEKIRNKFGGHH